MCEREDQSVGGGEDGCFQSNEKVDILKRYQIFRL